MGLFISMEGSDGGGKSTQIDLLEKVLRKQGVDLVCSREPGGTPIGEEIRKMLLDPANVEMDPRTEALLYAAARAQYISQVVRPTLERGAVLLSDRFVDSSLVYQGLGRGFGVDTIEQLNEFAIQGVMPDVTFIIYIDYEEGLRRKGVQTSGELDRMEQQAEAFHRRVNEGYLELARRYPQRIRLIDGNRGVEEIHRAILDQIQQLLDAHGIQYKYNATDASQAVAEGR